MKGARWEKPVFTAETEYDKVRVDVTLETMLVAVQIKTFLDGVETGNMPHREYDLGSYSDLFLAMDRRVEAGEVSVEYDTPEGLYTKEDLPEWLWHGYVLMRDPFRRVRSTPQPVITTVERRRGEINRWAIGNTQPRMFAYASINAIERTATSVRPKGVIWWHFCMMNVAAAQHDEWLEDENVWPAIERNMELDLETFISQADELLWNGPAARMEALTGIYKASASLSSAPTEILLPAPLTPVTPTLANGADEAKRILYGF